MAFHASQRCAKAVVDAVPERQMAGDITVEVERLGVRESVVGHDWRPPCR